MNSQESPQYQSKIRAVLDGLLTFISFNGEQAFFQDANQSAPTTHQMSKSPSPPKQPMPSQGKGPISPPKRSGGSPPKRPVNLPVSPQHAPLALPSPVYRAPATQSAGTYRVPATSPSAAYRAPAEPTTPMKKSNSSPKRVTWSPTNEINEIKSDSPVALPNRSPSPPQQFVKSILKIHQNQEMNNRGGSVYSNNQQKTIEWYDF